MYDYGLVADCALFPRDINAAIYIIYYTVINFHAARPVIEISSAVVAVWYRRVPGVVSPEVCLSLSACSSTPSIPFGYRFLSYRSRLVAVCRGHAKMACPALDQCNFGDFNIYMRGEHHAIKLPSRRNLNNFPSSVLWLLSSSRSSLRSSSAIDFSPFTESLEQFLGELA